MNAVIRPVQQSELRAALGALLYRPGTRSEDLQRQIDTLLRYAAKQHLSLEHCLVAETGGRIETACLCMDGPGRTSSVFVPNHLPTPARSDCLVAMLSEAVAAAQARRIRLMQGLVAPDAAGESELFARAGFQRLTELLYLERDATAPLPYKLPGMAVGWEEYHAGAHEEFARVVEGTYLGSLDCAGLTGIRHIEDTLASHRAAGEFNPRFWLLARARGTPVGVLLSARIPERGAMEVVYMGLLPEARGRGFGATLLRRAVEVARMQGAGLVTLTVDVENAPARKLYAAFDFQEWSRREVWIKVLNRA